MFRVLRPHTFAFALAAAPLMTLAAACSSSAGVSGATSATATSAAATSAPSTSTGGTSTGGTSTPGSTPGSGTPAPTPTVAPARPFTCQRTPSNYDDNLRLGDCDLGNGTVTLAEERLNILGYPCTIDGEFRADTDAAVRAFQRDKGLTVDGMVGPATFAALVEGGIGD